MLISYCYGQYYGHLTDSTWAYWWGYSVNRDEAQPSSGLFTLSIYLVDKTVIDVGFPSHALMVLMRILMKPSQL